MTLPAELADAAPERRKALVVGELGPAREGLARQLASGGWSVELCSPGFAAGAALARYQPHVLLLLATQPDGGETLAALRADREAGATPVVAVGHADWRRPLEAAGATVVLPRPLDPDVLAAALAQAAGPGLAGTVAAVGIAAPKPARRGKKVARGR
jgi:CheY-like chemotaxis protein